MNEKLKPCPFCGEQPEMQNMCGGYPGDEVYFCRCRIENHKEDLWSWQTRPLEDALIARAERAEAMVERLMRMVEDRFVLVGNSLDGHLQDCNCAVFLSSRMERDAWSELCYEWHGIYSDWQSANGHQAGKVSENEGSEG